MYAKHIGATAIKKGNKAAADAEKKAEDAKKASEDGKKKAAEVNAKTKTAPPTIAPPKKANKGKK